MNIYKAIYKSKIGNILIICNDNSLLKLTLNVKDDNINLKKETTIIKDTKIWLDKYFNKEKPDIKDINIKFEDTDFRKKVWQLLCNIPYGEITTYKNIAKQISKTMSTQAVGTAISKNPIPIIIPCHRVINTNNNIGNYYYGINTKIKLLKHENVDMSKIIIKLF